MPLQTEGADSFAELYEFRAQSAMIVLREEFIVAFTRAILFRPFPGDNPVAVQTNELTERVLFGRIG